ncbi:hypothetical protein HYT33_03325 [Candidatus Roizmanbacteria bacterium]|nr:hypothetical protein [Candidatus Roizmanbacteria bacterium]
MAIERDILRAIQEAPKGSKQEAQARALEAFFRTLKADGFPDVSFEAADAFETAKREPENFSEKSRKALKELGGVVYTPTGQTKFRV